MENLYVDISNLQVDAEAPEVSLASKDHYQPEKPLVFPARYFSPFRSIQVSPHVPFGTDTVDPANFDFALDFGKGGLVNSPVDDKKVFGAPKAYINTVLRKVRGGVGEGSKVLDYLLACGFEEEAIRSVDQKGLLSLMSESQNKPVFVRIGWQSKWEDGVKTAYTNSFKVGEEDGKSVYSPKVTLADGRQVIAVCKVEEFINPSKVRS